MTDTLDQVKIECNRVGCHYSCDFHSMMRNERLNFWLAKISAIFDLKSARLLLRTTFPKIRSRRNRSLMRHFRFNFAQHLSEGGEMHHSMLDGQLPLEGNSAQLNVAGIETISLQEHNRNALAFQIVPCQTFHLWTFLARRGYSMPSNFILMSLHNSNPLFSLLVKHSMGVTGFRFFFFLNSYRIMMECGETGPSSRESVNRSMSTLTTPKLHQIQRTTLTIPIAFTSPTTPPTPCQIHQTTPITSNSNYSKKLYQTTPTTPASGLY